MPAWRVDGVFLPGGDSGTGGVDGRGRWTPTPPDGAEPLPGRFVLPGLVDAHCHLSVGPGPGGRPRPLTEGQARANLKAARAAGVAVVRDLGGPGGVALRLLADEDGAGLIACGRFLAPRDRYFPGVYTPVASGDLVEAALAEVAAGARWVKLVGDFPPVGRGVLRASDAVPTYPAADVRRLVAAVHGAGARVAAHTTTSHAGELIAAGVDSIEHGDGMSEADVASLAERGGAWTPTLCATVAPPSGGEDAEGRRARLRRRERMAHLLRAARAAGVPILTGTDVVGGIAEEVALLVELGLPPAEALAAASTAAAEFLGVPGGLRPGRPANLVCYAGDPRDDAAVLARPTAVVVAGRRIV
ncbi:amidohydrolase family protein [Actinomadura chibensis]|uniref:Amidohydrolase family protein n=1 Tax=Actinomadura chibensis TaxID=392828 RepID=A0A5D0N6F6_9ACTN|nr:amidohydrolase family protein [Actinomadura chibensis]TYB40034.1 amidohydrolase family protein [Actinomadura chibensis]